MSYGRASCPCCGRALEVTIDEYDSCSVVRLEAVPLLDQPCTLTPCAYVPPAPAIGFVREVAVGRAVCNWLDNEASHVTPCYMSGPLGCYTWAALDELCSPVGRYDGDEHLVAAGHDACKD